MQAIISNYYFNLLQREINLLYVLGQKYEVKLGQFESQPNLHQPKGKLIQRIKNWKNNLENFCTEFVIFVPKNTFPICNCFLMCAMLKFKLSHNLIFPAHTLEHSFVKNSQIIKKSQLKQKNFTGLCYPKSKSVFRIVKGFKWVPINGLK